MRFTPKILHTLPENPGVYIFSREDATILYIGKAKNLKKRVSSYFSRGKKREIKINKLITQIECIDVILVQSEFEALLLEARLIKNHQPKYNVIAKDDKQYIYIKITSEEFPRVLFARNDREGRAVYFGPFPSTRIVRDILRFARSIFPYCTQKRSGKRACFYAHLGLCTPCPAEIKKETSAIYQEKRQKYRENIKQLKMLLSGRINTISGILRRKMEYHAEKEEYEEAQGYKEKSDHLETLKKHRFTADAYIENPHLFEQTTQREQKELTALLKAYFPRMREIHRIECYDISNISGKFAVGSCVVFVDGMPEKNGYRRFKIRLGETPDDFGMLSEVFQRRLKHAEWNYPDLFVVDGGKPQLLAVLKVCKNLQITIPLIGIAKRFEELVIPKCATFVKVKLAQRSAALHLIERLRDEAHRFAHTYHETLRLRNLIAGFKYSI